MNTKFAQKLALAVLPGMMIIGSQAFAITSQQTAQLDSAGVDLNCFHWQQQAERVTAFFNR